jgi:cytochrome c oxidase subunit IV
VTTATVDHTDHSDHDSGSHGEGAPVSAHDHPSDAKYWVIFGILVVITAVEVALSYAHIGSWFLPLLLGLMAVKFWTVVSFFMHLKFDHKLFGVLFYSGLMLAIAVYSAFLTTTEFWVK